MPEFYEVGKIVNTQGLNGEVRVISQTDFPEERFRKEATLYLFKNDQPPIKLKVKSHRVHKNFDILSFMDHPTINDVEHYREGILKVAAADQQPLPTGEYYYHQIIGLKVYDENQQLVGTITEILAPGANDVWVVERPDRKPIYLPYIPLVVKKVDLASGTVQIEMMEGLVDDED